MRQPWVVATRDAPELTLQGLLWAWNEASSLPPELRNTAGLPLLELFRQAAEQAGLTPNDDISGDTVGQGAVLILKGAGAIARLAGVMWGRLVGKVGSRKAGKLVKDLAGAAEKKAAPLQQAAPGLAGTLRRKVNSILAVLGWTAAGGLAATGGAAVVGVTRGVEKMVAKGFNPLLALGIGYVLGAGD